MNGVQLSPLAEKLHTAIQRLTRERVPHNCGGFTTDDMEWKAGIAFVSGLDSAIEELEAAKLIRFAGFDEDDAIGTCYELLQGGAS